MDKKTMQLSFDFTNSSSQTLNKKHKEKNSAVLCFNQAKREAKRKEYNALLSLYQSYAEKIHW